ncbi:MAG: DUF4405 domain-containing protein [Lachnospiraceae bacterium]|nr:DUF4405 domain-containing protein [Lachnospiraceae bacterium]
MKDHINKIKRIVDMSMTIALMFLMAYQVTGEAAHEWIGITMVLLVIIHQYLNKRWYSALLSGSYNSYRVFATIINILLLISFALTALSGMSMSNHAVPFLYNMINVNNARIMHLAFSYWSFVLMGIHLGLHMSAMTAKIPVAVKRVLSIIVILIAGYGLYLFIKSGILDYITFKSHFAFLDYEKAASLVFIDNVSMLIFFAFLGNHFAEILRKIKPKKA